MPTNTKMNPKDLEKVLVTVNNKSIHYSSADYIHIEAGGSDSWREEVMSNSRFVERWLAESDKTILQIIPYIIFMDNNGKIFSYQRRGGGEGRLEGSYSIGIGGHINDEDLKNKAELPDWDMVLKGAAREANEEMYVGTDYALNNLYQVATIYTPNELTSVDSVSNITPTVGEVHIGVVFFLPVSEGTQPKEADKMLDHKYLTKFPNLLKYEKWSQLCIQNINVIKDELRKVGKLNL